MNPLLVLPAAVAVAVGLGARTLQRRLAPHVAARVLTLLAAAAGLAVVWSVALVAVGVVVQIPWVAEHAGWCRSLYAAHDAVPTGVGLLALVALGLMTVAVFRYERRRRSLYTLTDGREGFVVVPCDEPTAFVVPGRPGRIVVSTGMLRALDPAERRVLIAHERAHLEHGHHRYLRVAELAAVAVPVLRPLARQVRFATERWADEEAVVAVGDRGLVARAISRAALAGFTQPAGALALAGIGVAARVEALLEDPVGGSRLTELGVFMGGSVALTSVAGSTVQFHHLLSFARHVCGL